MARRVFVPPLKPLALFDGDCQFCRFWIDRLKQKHPESVDYRPYQSLHPEEFPEINRDDLAKSIHLLLPDGEVCTGAEAFFKLRTLVDPGRKPPIGAAGGWRLFQNSAAFRVVMETGYSCVAGNRSFFSWLTRLFFYPALDSQWTRFFFIRGVGLIYLVAFFSLFTQIEGLVGSRGVIPAEETVSGAIRYFDREGVGLDRYRQFPTLCWASPGDRMLRGQCLLGMTAAILIVAGVAPLPLLFLAWLLYLSLCTIGSIFFSFQWDNLLLETGFLAVFFAPAVWFWRHPSQGAAPSRIMVWLFRFLLFRLMIGSGLAKLASGDPTWRNLTALQFHYETQPLPTPLGWFAHQLPPAFHSFTTGTMFFLELVVPFFIFAPARFRRPAALSLIGLQFVILSTGNYAFFNWLTIALCWMALDDGILQKIPGIGRKIFNPVLDTAVRGSMAAMLGRVFLTLIILVLSIGYFCQLARFDPPHWWQKLARTEGPLRTVNRYGLFSIMTTNRPELVLEGSNDGQRWLPYEFKYKPGDPEKSLPWVAPHQPRLDWQMWFAALSDHRSNPWLFNLAVRILEGSPPVLRLLETNPFPAQPPRYLRIVQYRYRFARPSDDRRGRVWERDLQGIYAPPLSLPERSTTTIPRL